MKKQEIRIIKTSFPVKFNSVASFASYEHKTRARRWFGDVLPLAPVDCKPRAELVSSSRPTGTYGCGPPRLYQLNSIYILVFCFL